MISTTGVVTGLTDSNGTVIKSGDAIRYEYEIGFSIGQNGEKTYSFPFSQTEKRFHQTIMAYQIKNSQAGYFLDLPANLNLIPDTLRYYVVSIPIPTKKPTFVKNVKAAVIIFHKNIKNYPPTWITECVDSIKNQKYKKFDVFEIDYGGTGTKIYEGSEFDSILMDNHALAHNYLLDKVFSLGYDCAFNVNVDDRYTLDRFEKQIVFIEDGYDVVSSNYFNIDENGNIIKDMQMSGLNPDLEANKGHNIIAHPAVCYSRNFWETCEKLNPAEIPVDDFNMWKRSYQSGAHKFVILPDYLLYYRIHDKKTSKSQE